MIRARWVVWAVAAMALPAAAALAQADKGGDPAAPAEPVTAAQLEVRLRDAAAKGKFTDEVADLFLKMADARAREKLVPSTVPQDFWQWVTDHAAVHKALLVNLHPDYKPGAVASLKTLRESFELQIEKHVNLALAFALVYGRAGNKPVRGGWSRKRDRSDTPGLVDSFRYYVDHRKQMLYPLEKVPWPLLVHVVDNDIPVTERLWAIDRFSKIDSKILFGVVGDVPVAPLAQRETSLPITKLPYTLANIREFGGTSEDKAYYVSRVLKSLGVPAMHIRGTGHLGPRGWTAWLRVSKGALSLQRIGRLRGSGYYVGGVRCPLADKTITGRDVELVAAAMNHSYVGYIDTMIACHVYDLVPENDRAGAVGVLVDAVKHRNPYCTGAWLALGAAVRDGALTEAQGDELYGRMLATFARYPDLTYKVLLRIITPKLLAGDAADQAEIRLTVAMLDRTYAVYQRAIRPDLAAKLRLLQGKYLEVAGLKDKALQLYINASEHYVRKHYGVVPLFDRAVILMDGESRAAERLAYMKHMAETVPEYFHRAWMPSDTWRQREGNINPAYTHICKAYHDALVKAGRTEEAKAWAKGRPEKPGTSVPDKYRPKSR